MRIPTEAEYNAARGQIDSLDDANIQIERIIRAIYCPFGKPPSTDTAETIDFIKEQLSELFHKANKEAEEIVQSYCGYFETQHEQIESRRVIYG